MTTLDPQEPQPTDGYRHAFYDEKRRRVRYSRSADHPEDPRCPECATADRGDEPYVERITDDRGDELERGADTDAAPANQPPDGGA